MSPGTQPSDTNILATPRLCQSFFSFSHPRQYSASSFQPLSIVSEWPRPANDFSSVTAGDLLYTLSVLLTSTGGTVLSASPEINSSGPRVALAVLTFVAELGLNVAVATWNSGRPGAGIAYLAYSSWASCSETALVKPKRNCASVSDTARLRLSGLPRTGKPDLSAESGSSGTPLGGAGSMAMAAAARSRPSKFCTNKPPKEWPMSTGFRPSALSW